MPDRFELQRFDSSYRIMCDAGGTDVNLLERQDELIWEAYTSKGLMSFSLIEGGMRAFANELGLGVIYDSEGQASALRIDVAAFLGGLLDQFENLDIDDLDDMFELKDSLNLDGSELMLLFDLCGKEFCIFEIDTETDERDLLDANKIDSFDTPAMISIKAVGKKFCVMVNRIEDNWDVCIGMYEGDDDEPSSIGDLPGEKKQKLIMTAALGSMISGECNYVTYLDDKKGDRFERLSKRIFKDSF